MKLKILGYNKEMVALAESAFAKLYDPLPFLPYTTKICAYHVYKASATIPYLQKLFMRI